MAPKIWTKAEIVDLIEATITETLADAAERRIKWSRRDLAEMIHHDLDDKGLLNDEP